MNFVLVAVRSLFSMSTLTEVQFDNRTESNVERRREKWKSPLVCISFFEFANHLLPITASWWGLCHCYLLCRHISPIFVCLRRQRYRLRASSDQHEEQGQQKTLMMMMIVVMLNFIPITAYCNLEDECSPDEATDAHTYSHAYGCGECTKLQQRHDLHHLHQQ